MLPQIPMKVARVHVRFDTEFLKKEEERKKKKEVRIYMFAVCLSSLCWLLPREAADATALCRLLSLFLLSVLGFTEAVEDGRRPDERK